MHYYMERLQIQAPALLLPLALASLRPLPARTFRLLLYLFFFGITLVALGTLFIYVTNYEAITKSYLYSKVIPNPLKINHVRLSLMLAISIFIGYHLFRQQMAVWFAWESRLVAACTVFLIVFIHIYSVRSGMLGFYAGCFALIVYHFIVRQRAWLKGLVILAVLGALPFVAAMLSPTLRNKTLNTLGDLRHYQAGGNANNYPMATRFVSYTIAFDIAAPNPWLGCGLGDLEDELRMRYATQYPGIAPHNRIIPHNQFIYYYAATGIIGLLIFIFSFYYPLRWAWRNKVFITTMHYLVVSLSFMVEPTLETQLGVAVAFTFLLLPLWQADSPKTTHVR
jgi:O-antigen ligase